MTLVGQVNVQMIMIEKMYSNMYSASYANTHHGVTIYGADGMALNMKNWLSQEWNVTFPEKKKFMYCVWNYHFQ